VETEEMKAKLNQDRGHRLIEEWNDVRMSNAVQKVQRSWRRKVARRKFAIERGKMNQEAALRRIQGFVRKWRQRRQPNLLMMAAQENPAVRPITAERLFKVEEEVLKKKSAYIPDMTGDERLQAERVEELRRKAAEKYRTFLACRPQERSEVMRTYLHREQTRQMIQTLEGRGWDRPMPYGVCSAALLREAEQMHEERKAAMARELRIGGLSGSAAVHTGTAVETATVTVAVESHTEAAEADQLLLSLESDLGYDFSEKHAGEIASEKLPDAAVFQPRLQLYSAGGYGGRLR
jgi:hypothetical protein